MYRRLKKWQRRLLISTGIFLLVIFLLSIGYHFRTHVDPPPISEDTRIDYQVINAEAGFYSCEKNWFKKSRSGLWELYLEGDPFTRGLIGGKLTKFLVEQQEEAFIKRLQQMIPSSFYQHFLKSFIYWFNRDIDKYISDENKLQIYGISLSASDRFSFMGSKYQRMLNYHSAHDIGHALVNLGMVGCTSFGVWNERSATGQLLIGRNFDFYMGEDFAREKIVSFEKPDKGFPFMIITWAGMIGAVSGMNDQGLTVSINAARSEIPFTAKTPISLLAREILQYASDIREAFEIAKKRETFVSESILIGSAKDNKAVIFEKSPGKMALVETTSGYIVCTNHFQSIEFQKNPETVKDMIENATSYRFQKVQQDLLAESPVDVGEVAGILRDRSGLNGAGIGNGNEKAINQLIAHHSVIFEPSSLRAWVSTNPWQLGQFVCYDISKIIHNFAGLQKKVEVQESDQAIAADPFLYSTEFRQFLRFREMKARLEEKPGSGKKFVLPETFATEFITTNPDLFEVYELIGDNYLNEGLSDMAGSYYMKALSKVMPRKKDQERIIKKYVHCRGN